MDKDTRNALERATQRARKLLEDDFAQQLEGTFDVLRDGTVAPKAGAHLSPRLALRREKIVASIAHKRSAGMSPKDAVTDYRRDAAFTALNRFAALKMLEARDMVKPCVTKGEQSSGYLEFCGLAPGVALLPEGAGYRLYIETLFDELSTEVKVLFDRRDPASVLWPKRATFEELLAVLNAPELAKVWAEDETIGWVYQYFNSHEEREDLRTSKAPQNSRELAVRNQFFTPRYVVQFLTDNTLGRIWYEMRGGQTALSDKCEYMVRKPGETWAPRAKKDPRDLRVLDPACGSGHFLLYTFDLLVAIHEEAWGDPESPKSVLTGRTLREDYPDLETLRKALPGLVLANNLHGVDIDPRCAQIAQLALWMRAQRAYKEVGVMATDRPIIRRSNIVIAEPLAADEETIREFVDGLGDVELGRVFRELVETLKLAGDMGLLLRVEELFKRGPKKGETGSLFAPPEERIHAALVRFVGSEGARANMRRRLFVEDAEHGMGLIETAEKKFDVVLMNPPFGVGSLQAKSKFDKDHQRTKSDVCTAFVDRGVDLLCPKGRLGAITTRTVFFVSTSRQWREETVLFAAPLRVFADLGMGVMDDAMVEAAAYCLERGATDQQSQLPFFRIFDETDKRLALGSLCAGAGFEHCRFNATLGCFSDIPGSPLAYWIGDDVRALFGTLPKLEGENRMARAGGQTSNDTRYLRAHWEVGASSKQSWKTYLKGGKGQKFYYDQLLMAAWDTKRETFPGFIGRPGRASEKPSNYELYFRPGITWPLRAASFSPQAMPVDAIFTVRSYAILDDPGHLLALLAILSSRAVDFLTKLLLGRTGFPEFVVGALQKVPIPTPSPEESRQLASLAHEAWKLQRSRDISIETSHAFLLPRALLNSGEQRNEAAVLKQFSEIQQEIDSRVFRLFAITDWERRIIAMTEMMPSSVEPGDGSVEEWAGDALDGEDVQGVIDRDDELRSWLVGVAFGRFDMRLVTGERPFPVEPNPFAPLPVLSPGMRVRQESDKPAPSVLLDDPSHPNDIVARIESISHTLNVDPGEELRAWLSHRFFPFHIGMYSKAGRKAPIYWQLATPSASYSVWLYLHAFHKDTLYKVQNDYVAPKLEHEERRLAALREALPGTPTSAERKALAAQETLVDELRSFLDEVKRVAPLWNPDLDDGVLLNFAPLWRLVPHHKPWQKEVKAAWDALSEGEYDWAHLAMHLWPERVVPKCATDRSLAIAHGLEDVFWVEDAGKWKPRTAPLRPADELVKERTSAAVKAALHSLQTAPAAQGSSKPSRRKGAR